VLGQLLAYPADWYAAAEQPYRFTATIAGVPCELRLNDFPEENIATLWIRGEQYELDEFPRCWRLPKHRGE